MKSYDLFVKGTSDGQLEPVRIISPKTLNDTVLDLIREMDYKHASDYCRNVLHATIMRGHPQTKN